MLHKGYELDEKRGHGWYAKEPDPTQQLANHHETGIYDSLPDNGAVKHLRDWNREADGSLQEFR